MLDQLKSMAIFAAVVELRSFRAAARRLGYSPSVVSNHVSTLEKDLGVALLFRSTRALSLTREGEQLYDYAAKLSRTARDGLDLFADRSSDKLTEFRIAIPVSLIAHPVFEKIVDFARDKPGMRLNLVSSDRTQDLLTDAIDVAVRMGRMRDSDLKTKRIGRERRILVGSPSYLDRRESPSVPKDLVTWDFISFTPVPDVIELRKNKGKVQKVWGNTAAVTDSAETMRALATVGLGVAGVPFYAAKEDLQADRLREVLPDWSGQVLDINLVWPRNSALNESTRAFIDHMSA